MNIVVCIKQVPDTAEVKINPETNTLIRDGVENIMNPFDRQALETALILRTPAERRSPSFRWDRRRRRIF